MFSRTKCSVLHKMLKRSAQKRLFIGFSIDCPWPQMMPAGRVLKEEHRHITLVFMGQAPFEKTIEVLNDLPIPFKIGLAGQFNRCLLLPPQQPQVLAWNVDWFENGKDLLGFWRDLKDLLKAHNLPLVDHKGFLPHVTMARAPFIVKDWEKSFTPLPFIVKKLHLYESVASIHYEPLLTFTLKSPIEQLTKNSVMLRGKDLEQLYVNAQVALSFIHLGFLPFISNEMPSDNLLEIKFDIERKIDSAQDVIKGAFKTVVFPDGYTLEEDDTLSWIMHIE